MKQKRQVLSSSNRLRLTPTDRTPTPKRKGRKTRPRLDTDSPSRARREHAKVNLMFRTEFFQPIQGVTMTKKSCADPAVFVTLLKPRTIMRPNHHFVSFLHNSAHRRDAKPS